MTSPPPPARPGGRDPFVPRGTSLSTPRELRHDERRRHLGQAHRSPGAGRSPDAQDRAPIREHARAARFTPGEENAGAPAAEAPRPARRARLLRRLRRRGGSCGAAARDVRCARARRTPAPGEGRSNRGGGDYRAPQARPMGARPLPGGPRAPAPEGPTDGPHGWGRPVITAARRRARWARGRCPAGLAVRRATSVIARAVLAPKARGLAPRVTGRVALAPTVTGRAVLAPRARVRVAMTGRAALAPKARPAAARPAAAPRRGLRPSPSRPRSRQGGGAAAQADADPGLRAQARRRRRWQAQARAHRQGGADRAHQGHGDAGQGQAHRQASRARRRRRSIRRS